MNIILFLKSFRQRKTQTALIIIQLTISFLAFIYTTTMALNSYEYYKFINNIFSFKKILVINTANDRFADTDNHFNIYNDIQNLNKTKDEKLIKSVKSISNELIEVGSLTNFSMSKDLTATYIDIVSKEFIADYDMKIKEGRTFTDEDFDLNEVKDIEPIIIGYDLGKSYNVGDIISYQVRLYKKNQTVTRKFEVIGIAEKDTLIRMYGSTNFQNIEVNNSCIYKPFNKINSFYNKDTRENSLNQLEFDSILNLNFFIEVNDEKDINEAKEEIEKIIKKYNYNYTVEKQTVNNQEFFQEIKNVCIQLGIFALIVNTFSVLGIMATITFLIKKRYREFGIKICQGAEIKDIRNTILIEIIIQNTISLIIATILAYMMCKKDSFSVNGLMLRIIPFSMVVFVIITIITIVPIMLKIKRISPVNLIRGCD